MSKVNFDRLDEYGYEKEPQQRYKKRRSKEYDEDQHDTRRSLNHKPRRRKQRNKRRI